MQSRPVVAVYLVLHFHIGVTKQEASIVLGNASLAQAVSDCVSEAVKVHARSHDAKAFTPRFKGIAECRTELTILTGRSLEAGEQPRAGRKSITILEQTGVD